MRRLSYRFLYLNPEISPIVLLNSSIRKDEKRVKQDSHPFEKSIELDGQPVVC